METDVIKAIGQLSVEVIAICALAVTVYYQAKAANQIVKAMNKLSDSMQETDRRQVKNIVRIADGVKGIERIAKATESSIERHQRWSEAAVTKLLNAQ